MKTNSLLTDLKNGENKAKIEAAKELAKREKSAGAAVQELVKCLKSKDEDLVYYSAYALGKIQVNSELSLPGLWFLFSDKTADQASRGMACNAIFWIGQPSFEIIAKGLKSSDSFVKGKTVSMIPSLEEEDAVKFLPLMIELLADDNLSTESFTIDSLQRMGKKVTSYG